MYIYHLYFVPSYVGTPQIRFYTLTHELMWDQRFHARSHSWLNKICTIWHCFSIDLNIFLFNNWITRISYTNPLCFSIHINPINNTKGGSVPTPLQCLTNQLLSTLLYLQFSYIHTTISRLFKHHISLIISTSDSAPTPPLCFSPLRFSLHQWHSRPLKYIRILLATILSSCTWLINKYCLNQFFLHSLTLFLLTSIIGSCTLR